MKYVLFVLDFDGTYDNEETDSTGVAPMVYLIPADKAQEVKFYAKEASKIFNDDNYDCDSCIGDLFEELTAQNGIDCHPIGSIEIPFEERKKDYLEHNILQEVV